MAEMAGCETPNLKVACSNPMSCKTFLVRCLFLFFLIALSIAAFLSCSCLCLRGVALPVYICIFEINRQLNCLFQVVGCVYGSERSMILLRKLLFMKWQGDILRFDFYGFCGLSLIF